MQSESPPCDSMEADSGCTQSTVNNPTLNSGTGGSISKLTIQTTGSERVAAGWDILCPDVKRIMLGQLSLNDLGRVARICQDFRKEFLSRLAEEQARLISVGHETFGKDMFYAIVVAIQRFLASRDINSRRCKERYCLITNAAGKPEYVFPSEADRYCVGESPFILKRRSWSEAELLWKFPGSGNDFCSIRILWFPLSLPLRFIRVSVSEGAEAAAMGFLLATYRETPADGTHASCPFTCTGLKLEGLQGVARKREAMDLIGPLRAMANSFTSCRPHTSSSQEKVGEGRPLGHLALL